MQIEKYNPQIYDISLVDLQNNGEFCLHGKHPCIIFDKVGNNYNIVPITNNDSNKIYWGEYPIEKGKYNLKKNSKLKLHQITVVSIEQIIHKISTADKDILEIISSFLREESNKIQRKFIKPILGNS